MPGGTRSYAGYHELAYLHPNRFRPDPAALDAFGVSPDEPYSIVRFVSWQAVHDRRERGLSADAEAAPGRGAAAARAGADLVRGPAPDDLAELEPCAGRWRTSTT